MMKYGFFTAATLRRRESERRSLKSIRLGLACFSLCLSVSVVNILAQETQPTPLPPRSVTIPSVKESKLQNGLTVAVIERSSVPLVTVQLLVKRGASSEDLNRAGLANLTAAMLPKGTKTRTATQIAEEIEFLGGSINT